MTGQAHRGSVLAIGLDLGSTRIKAGVLDEQGVGHVVSAAAPPLTGEGMVRECAADDYLRAALRVLREAAAGLPRGVPLGIASQRSTFALWEPEPDLLLTPLISWQDRRAAAWCAAHGAQETEVEQRTGLPLSPHYAGPKLAALREGSAELRAALDGGRARFGTLDTLLLRRCGAGRPHETDLTMAARTAMLDLATATWSPELLELFGVSLALLPALRPTAGRHVQLDEGPMVAATLADQAAGALAVLDPCGDVALVTLGTGGFVLRPAAGPSERRRGYLTAPILGSSRGVERTVLEGTVNGAGAALDRFPSPEVVLGEGDPAPEGLCLPDVSGLGSPHWRADLGLSFSPAAERLDGGGKRRAVLEGLLFRIRQILEDLSPRGLPERVVLSGGASLEPALAPGLATLLGRPVELLQLPEAGLVGAARLAAGLEPFATPATRTVFPGTAGAYLPEKYPRWRAWLASLLG